MKRICLIAATTVLALGAVAGADQFGRIRAFPAVQEQAPNPFLGAPVSPAPASTMGAAGVFTDFPPYPMGFTSYRGLGYQGYCCEQNPQCAQKAWEGYCEQKGCGGSHKRFARGWGHWRRCQAGCGKCDKCGKSRGFGFGGADWLGLFHAKPEWCCYPDCCNSWCGGPGANWWPVAPSCRKAGGCKLRRFYDRCCGIVNGAFCDDCAEPSDGKAAPANVPTPAPQPEPVPAKPSESAAPAAAFPGTQLPPSQPAVKLPDRLPPLGPEDKSA